MVKAIPDNYPRMQAYLVVKNATKAIEFYKEIFGATERMRLDAPGGRVGHCELEIGDSLIMVADECPEWKAVAPTSNTGISLIVYVPDADTAFKKALAADSTQQFAVETKFYGDRSGSFVDPYGHTWFVSTHVEDVSEEEMKKRAAAMKDRAA